MQFESKQASLHLIQSLHGRLSNPFVLLESVKNLSDLAGRVMFLFFYCFDSQFALMYSSSLLLKIIRMNYLNFFNLVETNWQQCLTEARACFFRLSLLEN
jgi:hypothetical protein